MSVTCMGFFGAVAPDWGREYYLAALIFPLSWGIEAYFEALSFRVKYPSRRGEGGGEVGLYGRPPFP